MCCQRFPMRRFHSTAPLNSSPPAAAAPWGGQSWPQPPLGGPSPAIKLVLPIFAAQLSPPRMLACSSDVPSVAQRGPGGLSTGLVPVLQLGRPARPLCARRHRKHGPLLSRRAMVAGGIAIPAVARLLPPHGRPVLRSHTALRRLESGALSGGPAPAAIGECLPHPPLCPAARFGRTGCRAGGARGLLPLRLEQPLLQRGLRLRCALLFFLSGGAGLLSSDSQRRPSAPPARQGCIAGPLSVRAQLQRDGRNPARHAAGLRVDLPPAASLEENGVATRRAGRLVARSGADRAAGCRALRRGCLRQSLGSRAIDSGRRLSPGLHPAACACVSAD